MKSLDCLQPRGLMVSFGNASGAGRRRSNLGILAAKGSLYVTRPTLDTHVGKREELLAAAKELFDHVLAGRIKIGPRQTLRAQGRGAGAPRPRGAQDHRLHDPGAVSLRRAGRAAVIGVAALALVALAAVLVGPPWDSSPEPGPTDLGFAGRPLRATATGGPTGCRRTAARRGRRRTTSRRIAVRGRRRRGVGGARGRSSPCRAPPSWPARPATCTWNSRARRWASWTTPSSRSMPRAASIHVKSAAARSACRDCSPSTATAWRRSARPSPNARSSNPAHGPPPQGKGRRAPAHHAARARPGRARAPRVLRRATRSTCRASARACPRRRCTSCRARCPRPASSATRPTPRAARASASSSTRSTPSAATSTRSSRRTSSA